MGIKELSDEQLMVAYEKATLFRLNKEFLMILEAEIMRRNLKIK